MDIVVITGGSRGIGASTALECAQRGLGTILTYNRNPDAAQGVVRQIEDASGKAVALVWPFDRARGLDAPDAVFASVPEPTASTGADRMTPSGTGPTSTTGAPPTPGGDSPTS